MQRIVEKWMKNKRSTHLEIESDGWKHVVYHNTRIVSFKKNAHITPGMETTDVILHHGGWMTVTTKRRMNESANEYRLHFVVWQKDHQWFVNFGGQPVPFQDGMMFSI